MEENEHADQIAKISLQHYAKLPKSGKPVIGKEWTLLSAILVSSPQFQVPQVVSMATGSKCIGRSKLTLQGDVVNDSHAEVLTRRAFLRYLYYQVELVLSGKKSEILEKSTYAEIKCFLKPDVKFHFFSSHTPCGDASIFPKDLSLKRKLDSEGEDESAKRLKTDENDDIHRTGAKCVPEGLQDSKAGGSAFHVTGALRTKPGRGDPTLSMSCSDKMAKWNVCGLQGALLSRILSAPIYLSTITLGKCPYCPEAMSRALISRSDKIQGLPEGYVINRPLLCQSSLAFEGNRTAVLQSLGSKVVPCSAGIIWSNILIKPLEVCVNGRRQGVTEKTIGKLASRLSICKAELFRTFVSLNKLMTKDETYKEKSYKENKSFSFTYQEALQAFKVVYSGWTDKPENLLEFTLDPK